MPGIHPLRRSDPPQALSDRAIADLRFIRETMERAGGFTVVPGWGQVAIGCTALVAAVVAGRQETGAGWLLVWTLEALLAMAIGAWAVGRKAAAAGMPLLAASRKIVLGLTPPLAAGALLTAYLFREGLVAPLPGLWLLLFGVSVAAVGTYSVRIVPAMGLCFMVLGGLALFSPPAWGNALMALGFGGVHIFFGIRIAWRHGG